VLVPPYTTPAILTSADSPTNLRHDVTSKLEQGGRDDGLPEWHSAALLSLQNRDFRRRCRGNSPKGRSPPCGWHPPSAAVLR
jgi:hypothetical protein